MELYLKHRIKFLILSLIMLAIAVGYVVYGLTSECGSFEGKSCPRGFKCNLTETPGMVVYGEYDRCVIRLGE